MCEIVPHKLEMCYHMCRVCVCGQLVFVHSLIQYNVHVYVREYVSMHTCTSYVVLTWCESTLHVRSWQPQCSSRTRYPLPKPESEGNERIE